MSEEDLFLIGSVISTWPHHHVCQLVGLSSNLSVVRSVLENLDFLLLSEHLLVIEVKLFDFAMVIYIGNKKAAIFWDLKSVRIYFANSACYLHNFCSLFEISAKFAYTLLLYTFFSLCADSANFAYFAQFLFLLEHLLVLVRKNLWFD